MTYDPKNDISSPICQEAYEKLLKRCAKFIWPDAKREAFENEGFSAIKQHGEGLTVLEKLEDGRFDGWYHMIR